MANFLDGSSIEIPKGQDAVLRRMNRDSAGNLIPCECVDPITKEPDKDRYCPICMGEGWKWTEVSVKLYKVIEDSDVDNALRDKLLIPGLINIPITVFYMRYTANVTRQDKIILLVTDLEGDTENTRQEIYRIETAWAYRSDFGRVEYWKLFVHKEDVKYLNTPSYSQV